MTNERIEKVITDNLTGVALHMMEKGFNENGMYFKAYVREDNHTVAIFTNDEAYKNF